MENIHPNDIEVTVEGDVVSFAGESYANVRIAEAYTGDYPDCFSLRYKDLNDGALEGECYMDGISFRGFTPDCYDIEIPDNRGGSGTEKLLSWHTDYDITDYEPEEYDDSIVPLSAELAWMLCHAVNNQ